MKLTNTLTQFDPTFHQNPMSPGVLQFVENYSLDNMCPKTQKSPNFR